MKTIFLSNNIITMEDNIHCNAILTENGIIKKVGTKEDILKLKDENTQIKDYENNCLMPSFIDAHSHITALAKSLLIANLSNAKNFDDIINFLNEYKENNKIKEGEFLIGFGYDHNFLKERKHPTRDILDKVSKEIPILITHSSGHMGIVNTKALEILNINKDTKDPIGGKIGRENGIPNGYLEESAFIDNTKKCMNISIEKLMEAIKKAERIYLQYGITTAQDGLTKYEEFSILKEMSKKNMLDIDFVSYVDIKNCKEIIDENKEYLKYHNRYKIGGYKLFLDGSPQGKTAWMSKPYENEKEYRGYPIYKDSEVEHFVDTAINENIQIITHCNGDSAADQLIGAFKNKKANIRPVMIHAQTVRKDQLKEMSKIGMIASFFADHIYFFGDIHLKNLGKRAFNISPIKSAIKNNVIYTIHEDTPVVEPNILRSIWITLKRKTKNGVILGKEEKISIKEALKATTINAAYSYFEENEKGSIKEGKNADFIILDKNPLKVKNIDEIQNIKVLETIKNSKSIYKKINN